MKTECLGTYLNNKYKQELFSYNYRHGSFQRDAVCVFSALPTYISDFMKFPYVIFVVFNMTEQEPVQCNQYSELEFQNTYQGYTFSGKMYTFRHKFNNNSLRIFRTYNESFIIDMKKQEAWPISINKRLIHKTIAIQMKDIHIWSKHNDFIARMFILRKRLLQIPKCNEYRKNTVSYILYRLSRVESGETKNLYKHIITFVPDTTIITL